MIKHRFKPECEYECRFAECEQHDEQGPMVTGRESQNIQHSGTQGTEDHSEKQKICEGTESALKGVAILNGSCPEALVKPCFPLFGGAMGEAVRDHVPLNVLLNSVISDGTCSVQGFFDVTFFK